MEINEKGNFGQEAKRFGSIGKALAFKRAGIQPKYSKSAYQEMAYRGRIKALKAKK